LSQCGDLQKSRKITTVEQTLFHESCKDNKIVPSIFSSTSFAGPIASKVIFDQQVCRQQDKAAADNNIKRYRTNQRITSA
jgi:hypothetical protein